MRSSYQRFIHGSHLYCTKKKESHLLSHFIHRFYILYALVVFPNVSLNDFLFVSFHTSSGDGEACGNEAEVVLSNQMLSVIGRWLRSFNRDVEWDAHFARGAIPDADGPVLYPVLARGTEVGSSKIRLESIAKSIWKNESFLGVDFLYGKGFSWCGKSRGSSIISKKTKTLNLWRLDSSIFWVVVRIILPDMWPSWHAEHMFRSNDLKRIVTSLTESSDKPTWQIIFVLIPFIL